VVRTTPQPVYPRQKFRYLFYRNLVGLRAGLDGSGVGKRIFPHPTGAGTPKGSAPSE